MKKVAISVAATLLVLVILAQAGLLEIFGIHGISFYTKKTDRDSSGSGFEAYTDTQTGVSYRFRAKDDYFYLYRNNDCSACSRGVNSRDRAGCFPAT